MPRKRANNRRIQHVTQSKRLSGDAPNQDRKPEPVDLQSTFCIVCQVSPPVAHGRCVTCYQYWIRSGIDRPPELAKRQSDLNRRAPDLEQIVERFLAKVDRYNGDPREVCWMWTAAKQPNGYGVFSVRGLQSLAHRFSYQMFVGPIPRGMQIDHICRRRACVNPLHLEAVTAQENILRAKLAR